ncbi:MAG: aminotransferase class V-fold PLP-dependent enzyme [Candidatus Latescibacterota bacterium]
MDIYDEIGVARVVNASGSMTYLGGSLMAPEVVEAMGRAARSFVRVGDLMQWAGREIARMTGAEAGLVTTGAAGGMLLATAACMTGMERGRMQRLPDASGMRDEVVAQHLHRVPFDHAVRTAGARLVVAGNAEGTQAWELEAAIGERTAALLHVVLDPQPTVTLEQAVRIAHARGLPVILDAAAELPPLENLRNYVAMGVDLVIFSGGKDIGGPNDTGILCGRRDLVMAAELQAFPNQGIGRPLKVSKEQIVGLIWALRRYVQTDMVVEKRRWEAMAERMRDGLQGIGGVRAEVAMARGGPRPLCIPRVRVQLDEQTLGRTQAQVLECLAGERPAVEVYPEPASSALWLNPQHLSPGEDEYVAARLRAALGG